MSRLVNIFFVFSLSLLFISSLYAKDLTIGYITRLNSQADAPEEQSQIREQGLQADQNVKQYLEKKGYKVQFIDQTHQFTNQDHYDLIILSSVVQSKEMADTPLKHIKIPLLTWENDLFDSLRLTGQKKGKDYGEITKEHYIRIINAPHPLAAGLPAGKTYVYPRDTSMGWGIPARASTVIATLPGNLNQAVVFGYEKGATMDYDFIAPERRVALFLDNTTFNQLSPTGLKLFDAAISWAINK